MKRHIISILKSPIGYTANLAASVSQYLPMPEVLNDAICAACETFALKDGIQDDPLF